MKMTLTEILVEVRTEILKMLPFAMREVDGRHEQAKV